MRAHPPLPRRAGRTPALTLCAPQIHGHHALPATRLPLHVALREHVEHGEHLQPQQWHGCGRCPCARGGAGVPGEGRGSPCQAALTVAPLPGTGMPAAYDLSSVIAGGSSVGHNNLIPLGECGACMPAWVLALGPGRRGLDACPSSATAAANTGIVNHTHSRMGSIMSTGIVQGNVLRARGLRAGAGLHAPLSAWGPSGRPLIAHVLHHHRLLWRPGRRRLERPLCGQQPVHHGRPRHLHGLAPVPPDQHHALRQLGARKPDDAPTPGTALPGEKLDTCTPCCRRPPLPTSRPRTRVSLPYLTRDPQQTGEPSSPASPPGLACPRPAAEKGAPSQLP